MAKQYLRCEYYDSEEGTPVIELHPDEYVITFKILAGVEVIGLRAIIDGKEWPSKDRDWCIANKEHVVPLNETKGLVELVDFKVSEDETCALVGIDDLGDQKISHFTVPLDEIVVE